MLEGVPGFRFQQLLPGKLPQNHTETNAVLTAIHGMSHSEIIAQLFHEKEIPFEELTKDDWLCADCLIEFIKHHFCRWWLDHKREGAFRNSPSPSIH